MAATHTKRRRRRANTARRHTTHHMHRRRNVSHRTRRNPAVRHHRSHRRSNPGGVRWGDVFVLGAGGLVGGSLPSAATQLVLGSSNSGALGYGVNLVATLVFSWVGGMFTRNKAFPAGILAGGVGSLMRRIIADYSLVPGMNLGSSSGMGDYMISNWVNPPRLVSDFRSLTEANFGQGQWGYQGGAQPVVGSTNGVDASSMGLAQGAGGSMGY